MSLSASVSNPTDVAGCGMQLREKLHRLESNGAVSKKRFGTPLFPNVELAGLAQSTWKSHIRIRSVGEKPKASSSNMTNGSGAPAGGSNPRALPSASDGSRLP